VSILSRPFNLRLSFVVTLRVLHAILLVPGETSFTTNAGACVDAVVCQPGSFISMPRTPTSEQICEDCAIGKCFCHSLFLVVLERQRDKHVLRNSLTPKPPPTYFHRIGYYQDEPNKDECKRTCQALILSTWAFVYDVILMCHLLVSVSHTRLRPRAGLLPDEEWTVEL